MNAEIDNQYQRSALIVAIGKAYDHSHKANDLIFKKEGDISVALAYLNSAISSMNSAMAIHTCIDDKLREFEEIYHRFNVFSDEFLSKCSDIYSNKRSETWSGITFELFEDVYKHSIVPDYPV